MKDLGITQKFLLLALNKNGKLSAWAPEQQICLVGGALLELLEEGCCRSEGKKVAAIKASGESAAYLSSCGKCGAAASCGVAGRRRDQ